MVLVPASAGQDSSAVEIACPNTYLHNVLDNQRRERDAAASCAFKILFEIPGGAEGLDLGNGGAEQVEVVFSRRLSVSCDRID